jgi:hypothetical protein
MVVLPMLGFVQNLKQSSTKVEDRVSQPLQLSGMAFDKVIQEV